MKYLGLVACTAVLLFSASVSAQQVVSLVVGDFSVQKGKKTHSSEFARKLESALYATRKFELSEYDTLANTLRNYGHDIEEFAKRKHSRSDLLDVSDVDYLLTGSVKKGANDSSKVEVELIQIAYDDASLIDTSGVLTASFKPTSKASLQTQAIAVIRDLVVTTLYPVRIVSASQPDALMLNYGEGILEVGDVLQVPSNAATLDQEKLPIKLRVTRVEERFSFAKVIQGEGELEAGMVLRPGTTSTATVKKGSFVAR